MGLINKFIKTGAKKFVSGARGSIFSGISRDGSSNKINRQEYREKNSRATEINRNSTDRIKGEENG